MGKIQDDTKQQPVTQLAFIGVYNGVVHEQHIHYENAGTQQKNPVEPFIPCQLQFFDSVLFGNDKGQLKLIHFLNEAIAKIDVKSGRGWFSLYAGYRYYKNERAVKGGYTDFFTDTEHLLPGTLTKIDKDKNGEARYHSYTVLMGREANSWYMDKGKLPPINELSMWKDRFIGDVSRFEKGLLAILEIYKKFRELETEIKAENTNE